MKKIFSVLAGVTFFLAFVPYIWAILFNGVTPSPITWSIWAGVDLLAYKAMARSNADTGQIKGALAGAGTVLALSLLHGQVSFGIWDLVSAGVAAVGLYQWRKGGNVALVWSQIALLVGSIPEFMIGWNTPTQEDPVAWSIWLLSCVFALLAVPKWDLENALQPITFTVIETVMVILVVILPMFH